MALNWRDIKTFNNSQNNAFEELVCQLARAEDITGKESFYRVAAPDGGVEAYCVLNNGQEVGWQAKYFDSMGTSQWSQLTESFKTALRTHPNLTTYVVCIPLDRQDPRREDQSWFMDNWNQKVKIWKEYAKREGQDIEFEYWGSSELVDRLSREENSGKRYFWFSQEEFSDNWFRTNTNDSINNLGPRYTAELNIELDIAKNFDSISRNIEFRTDANQRLHQFILEVQKKFNSIVRHNNDVNNEFYCSIENIKNEFSQTQDMELGNINIDSLVIELEKLEELFYGFVRNEDDIHIKESGENLRYFAGEANTAIHSFLNFVRSPKLLLANNPTTLILGNAGVGKSHLLADIATNKLLGSGHCIFLLGQHFSSEEAPWTQILRNLLRLDCNERQLLGALNAKAEADGERLLFIIDAINEGAGNLFWKRHINSFVTIFEDYPWVGLVMSLRSSYKPLLITTEIDSNEKVFEFTHSGFKGFEYQASSTFFSHYKIEQPSIPLLKAEFSNPLFLKLFCEGLNRKGLSKIPRGYQGITSIINFFIDSVDEKLSTPSNFNYPSGQNVVYDVLCNIIKYKLESEQFDISYRKAYELADQELSKYSNERRFLDALISEGVLSKNLFWKGDGEYEERIYLAYERFGDHLTTAFLLDKELSVNNLDSILKEGGKLHQFVSDSYEHQGIVEALSIQLPERTGKDLYELVEDGLKDDLSIINAFVYSLIWRDTSTIGEHSRDYVNEFVLKYVDSFDKFFQMVYSVAAEPDHYFNANTLHNYLYKLSLADIDQIWTTYLHDQNYESSAVLRLINWAALEEDKSYISDEAILLAAKALAWIFTSTNILLRDKATKALVRLLENRISTINKLLTEFIGVNDPYVYERVFAASYGAVLRSTELEGLGDLAGNIVENIFEVDEVYPNVLVRDYARNIVEYSIFQGQSNLEDESVIRPPYKSAFPSEFPTDAEIDHYKVNSESDGFKDYYWAQNSILSSMVTEYGRGVGGYGDFGRYTFQSRLYDWSDFNPNDLSNYACKLIFGEYGYDVEKHGEFDRQATSRGRSKNKTERIGKKYQWLALYEILARLADNHKVKVRHNGDDQEAWYCGPWDPFLRNIDPTVVNYSGQLQYKQLSMYEPYKYRNWIGDPEKWLANDQETPEVLGLVTLSDQEGEPWLVLENHYEWDQPLDLGQDKSNSERKNIWYWVKSYLVKKSEIDELTTWLSNKSLMGRWFPEGHDTYQVYSREFYWSAAYEYFNSPYFGGYEWKDISAPGRYSKNKPDIKVLPTAESYAWESGSDYLGMPSHMLPRRQMYSGMGLRYSRLPGEWLDENDKIACFDSTLGIDQGHGLVIRKDILESFLFENDLALMWTSLGEKNIFNGHDRYGKCLELSGVYVLDEGEVRGSTTPFFI